MSSFSGTFRNLTLKRSLAVAEAEILNSFANVLAHVEDETQLHYMELSSPIVFQDVDIANIVLKYTNANIKTLLSSAAYELAIVLCDDVLHIKWRSDKSCPLFAMFRQVTCAFSPSYKGSCNMRHLHAYPLGILDVIYVVCEFAQELGLYLDARQCE